MRVDSNATKVESGVIFLEFVGMHLVERESFFFVFFVFFCVCVERRSSYHGELRHLLGRGEREVKVVGDSWVDCVMWWCKARSRCSWWMHIIIVCEVQGGWVS